MTIPHMAEGKAWSEQMCSGALQFQIPTNFATANAQVKPTLLTVAAAPTSQLSPTSTISPVNVKVPIFCSPNGSVAGATGNLTSLPKGIAAGATSPAGSEFLIDCSGFPGDMINVTANYVGITRGANALECSVSCIDNVNKLIYLQVYNTTSGAAAAGSAGSLITCQVIFQDSYAV